MMFKYDVIHKFVYKKFVFLNDKDLLESLLVTIT